jgi:hypothetical protein
VPAEKLNDVSFEHSGPNGTKFTATRCDFREGVKIVSEEPLTPAQFAQDVAAVIGYHATNILPQLNGFSGYDAFKIMVKVPKMNHKAQ